MERMEDFFTARVETYDEHMLTNIHGIEEAYERMAALLPENAAFLLDLGCGTGLELAPIFARFPNLQVTGVDLTQAMLDKLTQKYPSRHIELICGGYFAVDFGMHRFDAAVSFQTLHHFTHDEKRILYRKIRRALRPGGVYVEVDYIVGTQTEEDAGFAARDQFMRDHFGNEHSVDPRAYHIDVPCTVNNLERLLAEASFESVRRDKVWENMAILVARTQGFEENAEG